jgi:uncharacterized protein YndB with AHSA1/START domain
MPATNKHATTFTTPSDTDVVVTRTFDAPRKLVFEAHTSCKHMPNWMGPHGWTMSECKNDLRPGGDSPHVEQTRRQRDHHHGREQGVDPPSRGQHESWGDPWPVATNILEFTEVDGQTTLVMTIRYTSKARDGAATGMKDGMTML